LNASSQFDVYRALPEFAPRPPDLSRQEYPDETNDLCDSAQVTSLQVGPANAVQYAVVALEGTDETDGDWLNRDKANKYLWLVRTDDVRICLENGELGKSTSRKRLSHTNLSGIGAAHCGGELWFRDATSIYLNGLSSRFTARNPEELVAIANSFHTAGYQVCSYGWNYDTGAPKRTLRKREIAWL
jgi:hypothetical protein